MRISLKWLSELVDLPMELPPHDIAEHLTMAGLEVEGITQLCEDMKDVLIAQVAELSTVPKRPGAHLCKIDIGSSTVSIVTTAKNLHVGDFVVVALPGAKLFGGISVEAQRNSIYSCSLR